MVGEERLVVGSRWVRADDDYPRAGTPEQVWRWAVASPGRRSAVQVTAPPTRSGCGLVRFAYADGNGILGAEMSLSPEGFLDTFVSVDDLPPATAPVWL
jgi:hypothetical protein